MQVPAFRGIIGAVESGLTDWEAWFREAAPEAAELPGEWEARCSDLQRMVLVRCLRPDRVLFAATAFVATNLGRKYVEPPVLDLGEVFRDSTPVSPLIFVLSPGVDPTDALRKLGAERGMADRIMTVALGQVRAKNMYTAAALPMRYTIRTCLLMRVPECARPSTRASACVGA